MTGLTTWIVHRATGLVLLVGLALHFYVMHFAGTEALSYEEVARRLSSTPWMLFNAAFLISAIYHGFYGLWGIATEYLSGNLSLKVAKTAIIASSFALVIVGMYILTI